MPCNALHALRGKIQKFRKSREPERTKACPNCEGSDGELIQRSNGSDACDKCSVICNGCFCYCDPDCMSGNGVCHECRSEPSEKVKKFAAKGEQPKSAKGLGETRFPSLPGSRSDLNSGATPMGFPNIMHNLEEIPEQHRNPAIHELAAHVGHPIDSPIFAPESQDSLYSLSKSERTNEVGNVIQSISTHTLNGEPLDYKTMSEKYGPEEAGHIMVSHALLNGGDEATTQLQDGKEHSGIYWYSHDLSRLESGLISLFGKRKPDGSYEGPFGKTDARTGRQVGKDNHNMILFKTLLAPHSYGNDPVTNFDGAMRSYLLALHHSGGDFDKAWEYLPEHTGIRYGKRVFDPDSTHPDNGSDPKKYVRFPGHGAAPIQMRFIRTMVRDIGAKAAADFLKNSQPIDDVKAADLKYTGTATANSYFPRKQEGKPSPEEKYPGAFILGPKGGAFALNLMRRPEFVTKDMWFSRLWNRLMGTLVEPDNKGNMGIVDSPRGPHERKMMDQFVDEGSKRLGVKPAEFQAVLWYYEQRLWRSLRADAQSFSFADAVRGWLHPSTRSFPDGTLFSQLPSFRGGESLFGDVIGKHNDVPTTDVAHENSTSEKSRVAAIESASTRKPRKFAKDEVGNMAIKNYHRVFSELRKIAQTLKNEGRLPSLRQVTSAIIPLLPTSVNTNQHT